MSDRTPTAGLEAQGIETRANLHWNLVTARLIQSAIARGEGKLSADGPLVVETGAHTGRSAQDKFIVRDTETENTVWWGKSNKAMSPEHFAVLKADFLSALRDKEDLFVQDLFGGSQPEHRVNVRVINELAWHNSFIRTMLVRPEESELRGFVPDYTIIDLPSFRADPARHGCRSETHQICRRDEEIGVQPAQLLAAADGRDADALLGQYRQGWRHRRVLRPVGHRQDHAQRRCQPHVDRR
jgi:phosphoenolpyruvate carboxykinase (ATP)